MEGRNLCLDITFAVAVEDPHAIKGKCSLFSFWGFLKRCRIMPKGGRWWAVLLFLAVLILVVVLVGGRSPSSKAKQKRKKTKKRSRSRSPQHTTGHTVKKRTNVFKRCGRCRPKFTVTDTHDLCLACLGREHPMLDRELCMAFT